MYKAIVGMIKFVALAAVVAVVFYFIGLAVAGLTP